MLVSAAFYAFSAILIGCAVAVITSRSPVHSVLFLILAFFNAAALFLIAGAEFLAMILVIVYVGAVAVLFLFVVMMLDVNFGQLREGYQKYAPIGAAVGAVLFAELILVLGAWRFAPQAATTLRLSSIPESIDNTTALGRLIYTDYIFLFQTAGLILMVAMIGAIVLTHRDKTRTKRQNIATQNARTTADTLQLVQVKTGAGVEVYLRPKVDLEPVNQDEMAKYTGLVEHREDIA